MKVQPGQSRSGQAGSESCHSPGDRRVRSVDSEEAGREDSAPKAFAVADADAVSLAEGSIWATVMARSPRAAGVHSPGHVSTGAPQEPRRAPHPLRTKRREWFTRAQRTRSQVAGIRRLMETKTYPTRVPGTKGDRRCLERRSLWDRSEVDHLSRGIDWTPGRVIEWPPAQLAPGGTRWLSNDGSPV